MVAFLQLCRLLIWCVCSLTFCLSVSCLWYAFIDQQQKKTADSPQAMCWAENEDYFECIHGFKEKARILQVMAEKKRREKLGEKFDI